MDIGMPSLNGIEACRQIRAALPETQVVMLSMHSDEGYVLRALKAGAKAYLLKDSAEADLARAIRAVAAGKSFFSPAVGKVLLEDYMRKLRAHRRGGFLRAALAAGARDPATGGGGQVEQRDRESAESQRLYGGDASRQGHAKAESARHSRTDSLRRAQRHHFVAQFTRRAGIPSRRANNTDSPGTTCLERPRPMN